MKKLINLLFISSVLFLSVTINLVEASSQSVQSYRFEAGVPLSFTIDKISDQAQADIRNFIIFPLFLEKKLQIYIDISRVKSHFDNSSFYNFSYTYFQSGLSPPTRLS